MGHPAHLKHVPGGLPVALARQLRSELARHRYQGQVPAEQVVQVAGEAQPLLRDGQACVRGPGSVEFPVSSAMRLRRSSTPSARASAATRCADCLELLIVTIGALMPPRPLGCRSR